MRSKECIGVQFKRLDVSVNLKSNGIVKLSYNQGVTVLQHVLGLKVNYVFFFAARQWLARWIADPYLISCFQQFIQFLPASRQGRVFYCPGVLKVKGFFIAHLAELDFEQRIAESRQVLWICTTHPNMGFCTCSVSASAPRLLYLRFQAAFPSMLDLDRLGFCHRGAILL